MELSEEEKQQVMMTEEYKKFLDRTSRVMERALTQDIDIFVDYTGELGDDGWAIFFPRVILFNFFLLLLIYGGLGFGGLGLILGFWGWGFQ